MDTKDKRLTSPDRLPVMSRARQGKRRKLHALFDGATKPLLDGKFHVAILSRHDFASSSPCSVLCEGRMAGITPSFISQRPLDI